MNFDDLVAIYSFFYHRAFRATLTLCFSQGIGREQVGSNLNSPRELYRKEQRLQTTGKKVASLTYSATNQIYLKESISDGNV